MARSFFSLIVNQAVNIDKEVIFIGIPKTGTTTVRNQLLQRGKPLVSNPHLDIVQIRDLIYLYLLKKNLGTNKNFPNSNHPKDLDLRKQAEKMFNSFFKFSGATNSNLSKKPFSVLFAANSFKTAGCIVPITEMKGFEEPSFNKIWKNFL